MSKSIVELLLLLLLLLDFNSEGVVGLEFREDL